LHARLLPAACRCANCEAQAGIECEVFDRDGVQLQLRLPESLAAPMQAWISDLTRGRSEAMRLDCLD
jgi:hypothetical protein